MINESEEAVRKARSIQQRELKTIRVGSSFLNPSNVLTDLWHEIEGVSSEYRLKIIPYHDDHDQIMSVVASLGKTMDFMVGVFGSQQMLKISEFYELGRYRLCIAVPRNHRLAAREKLTLSDLHGEHLIAVKSGDALYLDDLREKLRKD